MKRHLKIAAMSLFAMSASAYAQEHTEMEVDMSNSMPMGMPGPGQMGMKVKVRQTTTTTTTTTSTTTSSDRKGFEENEGHRRHRKHHDREQRQERDCGTGEDSGCTTMRNGRLPMDAEAFYGFLDALKSNTEMGRGDVAKSVLKNSYLTARQLGQVLDVFETEIYRYEVAQHAASKVVNPSHALGHAKKFDSSIYAADYTKLMTAQR